MYYNQALEKSNNKMRTTWHIINEEKGLTRRNILTNKIIHKNKPITNLNIIANLFNNHFLSMADLVNIYKIKDINPHIDNSMKYLNKHSDKSFSNITWKYATTHKIEKIVKSLKNTNCSGYDEITTQLLKLSIPYIISQLTHICNSALSSGVFPNRLKYAIVTPIHKSGDSHLISNYRPISMLTVFSKILEKLIYTRIINHLKQYNILTSHQFGFREHHSTEQATFSLISNLLAAMNQHQIAGGMFCDLHKAFDSVNHQILFKKIQFYGIRSKMEMLIQSYLTNRHQKVISNNVSSTC